MIDPLTMSLCNIRRRPKPIVKFYANSDYWDEPLPMTLFQAIDRLASAYYRLNGKVPEAECVCRKISVRSITNSEKSFMAFCKYCESVYASETSNFLSSMAGKIDGDNGYIYKLFIQSKCLNLSAKLYEELEDKWSDDISLQNTVLQQALSSVLNELIPGLAMEMISSEKCFCSSV